MKEIEWADITISRDCIVAKLKFIVFAILGPTSIEFTSELHDFLTNDVSRWYPELADKSSVILVEAGKHLLGTFDESLSTYVEKLFEKRKVKFLTNAAVAKVVGNTVILNSGEKIPFGACVWSTGNTALDFVRELGLPLSKDGRIKIDEKLRVQTADGKYSVFQKYTCILYLVNSSYSKRQDCLMEKSLQS